jgi:putative serine protease PepD
MSYPPEPGHDRSPWAGPSPAAGTVIQGQQYAEGGTEGDAERTAPTAPHPTAGPEHTAPLPVAGGGYEGGYQGEAFSQAPPPDEPVHPLFTTPYGSPGPQVPRQRERRGPGWSGTIAVGAGAAVLSSLLTLGIHHSQDTSSAAAAQPYPNPSQNSAPLVTSNASNPNWTAVAGAVQPSVVAVQLQASGGGDEGSGIVYDAKGHVLTNNHVVAAASNGGQLSVILSDGRTYGASVVGTDPSTDLAVLQIKNPPSGLKPARIGNSDAVKVGDPVMALGNPLGLSDTVTTGIVSALNRPITTSQSQGGQDQNPFGLGQSQAQSEQVVTNAIQTDAAINPGNSGGALVDASGRVIGVTSSIASLGSSLSGQSGNIGLGFAIPSNEAQDVANQLIQTGSVKHALLGVTLKDGTVSLDGAQRQAAVIQSVSSGGAAQAAGIKSGDAVIALNGSTIDGSDSLVARIRAIHPGTKITLSVVRDGKQTNIQVTLGTRPASNNG